MKLVIDIPEEEYEFCKRQWDTECLDVLMIAVKYGTPLPKHHGRIMDVDKIIKKMEEREEQLKDDRSMYETSCVETAVDMFGETIIEVKEESEGKK